MAVALLVAAGSGERLGASRPKAFVVLGGRPMLEWSLDALRAAGIEEIVVALPEGERAPEGTVGVRGGATRTDSVRAALAAASGDPVVIHDAARPLVTPDTIGAALEALRGADAVVVAAPVTDTIKEVAGDGTVRRTVPREDLWAAQTPQVLRREALERGLANDAGSATDDVALVEPLGRVRVVQGPPDNLKVTTPADLRVARALIANAALVRRICLAVERREDLAWVFDVYAEDVVWDVGDLPAAGLGEGRYVGHDGLRRFWREWVDAWEAIEFDYQAFVPLGDRVAVLLRQRARGRGSRAEVQTPPYAQVWTFRDGKIAHIRAFADPAQALRLAREAP